MATEGLTHAVASSRVASGVGDGVSGGIGEDASGGIGGRPTAMIGNGLAVGTGVGVSVDVGPGRPVRAAVGGSVSEGGRKGVGVSVPVEPLGAVEVRGSEEGVCSVDSLVAAAVGRSGVAIGGVVPSGTGVSGVTPDGASVSSGVGPAVGISVLRGMAVGLSPIVGVGESAETGRLAAPNKNPPTSAMISANVAVRLMNWLAGDNPRE